MTKLRVKVNHDHQQFSVSVRGAAADTFALVSFPAAHPAHIINWVDSDWLSLTALGGGPIDLGVEFYQLEPDPLDKSWDEVAEISLMATDDVRVEDFAALPGAGTQLPLGAGTSYRVRYGIGDVVKSLETGGLASYILQIWPAPALPPQVTRQTTSWGMYWRTENVANWAYARVRYTKAGPTARTAAAEYVVAESRAAIPELSHSIRSGETLLADNLMRAASRAFMDVPADDNLSRDEIVNLWRADEQRIRHLVEA
ncbi:MAG TPA: hypothetical protein VNT53_10910 [Pseudolysinimonas sp.]|nr:hypothetical protein [Pseudolysinimonas sp.]